MYGNHRISNISRKVGQRFYNYLLKVIKIGVLVILICNIQYISLAAQESLDGSQVKVTSTNAIKLGHIPEIRHLKPLHETPNEKLNRYKAHKQVPNFRGRGISWEKSVDAIPTLGDPVLQRRISSNRGNNETRTSVNFDGISESFSPHDPALEVGHDHVIQMVNASSFRVWDKQGNPLSDQIAMNTIWAQIGSSSAGDPIILYDQETRRWILTEFPPTNTLLIAVSDGPDPLGAYTAYSFSTPTFPDYPKYAIWNDVLILTTNEFGENPTLKLYAISKLELFAGTDEVAIQRFEVPRPENGPGFFVATPVDWTGLTKPVQNTGPYFLHIVDDAWGAQDGLVMHEIDINWTEPELSEIFTNTITTAAFDSDPCSVSGYNFACVPQPDGAGLDAIPFTIMHQVHYRNFGTHESIVLNFAVNANTLQEVRAGIRWMELRRAIEETEWQVHQEGTFAPDDGNHRMMGGISMNVQGNIGLAYATLGPESFAGLRFTGRSADDELGLMTLQEGLAIEGQSLLPPGRFGDYAQMVTDPRDDRSFWYTAEYAGPEGGVNTRIFSFQVERDLVDLKPLSIITPTTAGNLSNDEELTIEILNNGQNDQQVFQLGFRLNGEMAIIEQLDTLITPNAKYRHSFQSSINLEQIGPYELEVFTIAEDDGLPQNDTIVNIIESLPKLDLGLSKLRDLDNVCGNSSNFIFTLTNRGANTARSANIEYILNDIPVDTLTVETSLGFRNSETISHNVVGLVDGTNEVKIILLSVNNEADEIQTNDTLVLLLENRIELENVFLEITTDNFPGETTYQVTDDAGKIIATNGELLAPAQENIDEFCLHPDSCYTFTIFDAYGDGICCYYGSGNYQLIDASGNILATSPSFGEFGFEESFDFCVDARCLLEYSISTANTTDLDRENGAIIVETENGFPPYNVSLINDAGEDILIDAQFEDARIVMASLPTDKYHVMILDARGCLITSSVILNSDVCAINVQADVQNTSQTNAADGSIRILAEGGVPMYTYTLSGMGEVISQQANIFEGLAPGDYTIIVEDSQGCFGTIEVTVDVLTSIVHFENQEVSKIESWPNPTENVLNIKVPSAYHDGVFLNYILFDNGGKVVRKGVLPRYDSSYVGQISLMSLAQGMYYCKLYSKHKSSLLKVSRI